MTGRWIDCLMAWLNPAPETKPNLADISCSTMVVTVANSIVHNNAKPKLLPARRQTVTVPGPINAAVIRMPGPVFFRSSDILFNQTVLL